MELLNYPFNAGKILRKRSQIRRELLATCGISDTQPAEKRGRAGLLYKKIAILGGYTTADIRDILELFLLQYGIVPEFYESEYNQYWQDAVFENERLNAFGPDVIYICTSNRNILQYPDAQSSDADIERLLEEQYDHFLRMWEALEAKYACPIIQNNFELPYYRLLGNMDASDAHGRVNFLARLNEKLYAYSQQHKGFYINDILYQQADFGLQKWSDPYSWYLFKYALSLEAIPTLCFNVANIIKSIYGKNKKALALDLDNTLWGGVVGDDGPEGLELGQETAVGQIYIEFQSYLKELQKRGILLNVISKNNADSAKAGLDHPAMLLKPEDFTQVTANWAPKSENLLQMADALSLLPESFVFVDDNPAEREIVRQAIAGTAVPELTRPEHYILALDRAGYFEATSLSQDDLQRASMYRANAKRADLQASFSDYNAYLLSLQMQATIRPFESVYYARIAQLTNKSNQFNLTTLRLTESEVEAMAVTPRYLTLYGTLSDRFGDNGVVALAIGEIKETPEDGRYLDIILWLMSCRVLKRDMECAMMDELFARCREKRITAVFGHYYPSAKNRMVRDFYRQNGFTEVACDADGHTIWKMAVAEYQSQNHVITVNR